MAAGREGRRGMLNQGPTIVGPSHRTTGASRADLCDRESPMTGAPSVPRRRSSQRSNLIEELALCDRHGRNQPRTVRVATASGEPAAIVQSMVATRSLVCCDRRRTKQTMRSTRVAPRVNADRTDDVPLWRRTDEIERIAGDERQRALGCRVEHGDVIRTDDPRAFDPVVVGPVK